jgi:hypothetical protein
MDGRRFVGDLQKATLVSEMQRRLPGYVKATLSLLFYTMPYL